MLKQLTLGFHKTMTASTSGFISYTYRLYA